MLLFPLGAVLKRPPGAARGHSRKRHLTPAYPQGARVRCCLEKLSMKPAMAEIEGFSLFACKQNFCRRLVWKERLPARDRSTTRHGHRRATSCLSDRDTPLPSCPACFEHAILTAGNCASSEIPHARRRGRRCGYDIQPLFRNLLPDYRRGFARRFIVDIGFLAAVGLTD